MSLWMWGSCSSHGCDTTPPSTELGSAAELPNELIAVYGFSVVGLDWWEILIFHSPSWRTQMAVYT